MTKKVLIVSRRQIRKNKPINWVSEIYATILCSHGIMPIFVPIAEETKNILQEYLSDYDGLMMVEGGDVNPQLYGDNYDNPEELDLIKDDIETACFKHAYAHDKAILGFCRGLHIINVMLGGTLHRDVHEYNKNLVKHIDYEHYDEHRHCITIIPNTPLHSWYNQNEIKVNSYHHQGIKVLGKGLVAMATANDGLIEAVYAPEKKFLVGLQFHPERMLAEYQGNQQVFDSFINAL